MYLYFSYWNFQFVFNLKTIEILNFLLYFNLLLCFYNIPYEYFYSDWIPVFNFQNILDSTASGWSLPNGLSFTCKHQLWSSDVNASDIGLFSYVSAIVGWWWKDGWNKNLVYTNMGWLGDGSHRGQCCQAWTVVGLPPRYPHFVNWISCVSKHLTGPKHGSVCDLFLYISNIRQQPASWHCQNVLTAGCTVHLSLFSRRIYLFWGSVLMAQSAGNHLIEWLVQDPCCCVC